MRAQMPASGRAASRHTVHSSVIESEKARARMYKRVSRGVMLGTTALPVLLLYAWIFTSCALRPASAKCARSRPGQARRSLGRVL